MKHKGFLKNKYFHLIVIVMLICIMGTGCYASHKDITTTDKTHTTPSTIPHTETATAIPVTYTPSPTSTVITFGAS